MSLTFTAIVLALVSTVSNPPGGRTPVGTDSLMGTGVSRALATTRAAQIRDVRYALSFDLTERDSSRGTVTARFRATRQADVILDFRGLRLGAVEANGKALERVEFNGAHVRIPAAAVVAGENVIVMSFVTKIAAAGSSIIRYRDVTDGSEYLYTLLVPADANQLFPCFDQPDLKAKVRLRLIAPKAWRTVANGPLGAARDVSAGASGATEHTFEETEPIST